MPNAAYGAGARLAYMGWNAGTTLDLVLDTATQFKVTGAFAVTGGISATSASFSAYSTLTGLTNNGWFYTGINSPAYPTSFGGLAISWNFNVGQGDIDFWNCYTGGSGYTSFFWYQLTTAGSAATKVMQVGPSGLLVPSTFLKTGGGASYRMSPNADTTGIGSFWYTDPSTMYLLLTANNDAWGSFNGLRPLAVDLATGVMTLGHRVTMNQGLTITGIGLNALTVTGWNIVLQNSASNNYIMAQNSGGSNVKIYDDGNSHIEASVQLWINNATGAYTQIGGGMTVAGAVQINGAVTTNTAITSANNGITSNGPNAILFFQDRGGGSSWGWYSTGGVARLYNGADRVTIDGAGNINCGSANFADLYSRGNLNCAGSLGGGGLYLYLNGWGNGAVNGNGGPLVYGDGNYLILKPGSANLGVEMRNYGGARIFFADGGGNCSCPGNLSSTGGSVGVNGIWCGNNGGWWWTGSPIHTDSTMECGRINIGGHGVYDSGGWEYHDAGIHAGELHSRDNIWCAGTISSGGSMTCGHDLTAQGWYYGGGNGGAQIRCWAGDWGAMSYAMSGAYFEVSPDQGASGYYFANAGNWSDARLKLNIRDSEIDALAVLGRIPVRAFEWTEEGQGLMPRDGPSVACGIVAQELEALLPSAVDIVPIAGGLAGGGMRRIVSDQLDAYYIRAIQQLTEELAAVKAQLAQLGRLLSP